MNRAEVFLSEVDAAWTASGKGELRLEIIGACALALLALAGPGTALASRAGIYFQFVAPGVPFLPQRPRFTPVPSLAGLVRLRVSALEVVDVAVSKLKPFRTRDVADIKEMFAAGRLDAEELLARLRAAVEWYSLDARAEEDLPRIVRNFHAVQRDILMVPRTEIDY